MRVQHTNHVIQTETYTPLLFFLYSPFKGNVEAKSKVTGPLVAGPLVTGPLGKESHS